MNSTHLTDETLQAFLLNEMQDDTIASHIEVCAACREKLETYQHLMVGISQTPLETFSFDVSTVVMEKIMQYEKKNKQQESFYTMIWIVLLVLVASFSIPFFPSILKVFYSKSTFSMLLVIATGVSVLLFLVIDIIRQFKMKVKKFENYLQPTL